MYSWILDEFLHFSLFYFFSIVGIFCIYFLQFRPFFMMLVVLAWDVWSYYDEGCPLLVVALVVYQRWFFFSHLMELNLFPIFIHIFHHVIIVEKLSGEDCMILSLDIFLIYHFFSIYLRVNLSGILKEHSLSYDIHIFGRLRQSTLFELSDNEHSRIIFVLLQILISHPFSLTFFLGQIIFLLSYFSI